MSFKPWSMLADRPTACFPSRARRGCLTIMHPGLIAALDVWKRRFRIDLDARNHRRARDAKRLATFASEPRIHRQLDTLHSAALARDGNVHRHRCESTIGNHN